MAADTISISRALANQIFHMAQEPTPSDAILGGRGKQPRSFERIKNPSQNWVSAQTRLSDRGETVFASVHIVGQDQSPEARLREIASTWPETLRILVLLDTKGVLELKAYRLEGSHWQALELRLEDATH